MWLCRPCSSPRSMGSRTESTRDPGRRFPLDSVWSADIFPTGSSRLRRGPLTGRRTMALFSDAGIQFLFRWVHFLSGITWIGLLYYFNFVQGPFMAEADAATKSGATQKLVPRALAWFRWSALLTFLTGAAIIGKRIGESTDGSAAWSSPWAVSILTGALFGTVMLANVWRVIWPRQ